VCVCVCVSQIVRESLCVRGGAGRMKEVVETEYVSDKGMEKSGVCVFVCVCSEVTGVSK